MSRTLTIGEWIQSQIQRGAGMGRRTIPTCQRIRSQMQDVAGAMARYERRREAGRAATSTEQPRTEQPPRGSGDK